jgi:hypothetical protein
MGVSTYGMLITAHKFQNAKDVTQIFDILLTTTFAIIVAYFFIVT